MGEGESEKICFAGMATRVLSGSASPPVGSGRSSMIAHGGSTGRGMLVGSVLLTHRLPALLAWLSWTRLVEKRTLSGFLKGRFLVFMPLVLEPSGPLDRRGARPSLPFWPSCIAQANVRVPGADLA